MLDSSRAIGRPGGDGRVVIVIGLVVVPQGTVLLLTLMYLLAKRYTTWGCDGIPFVVD